MKPTKKILLVEVVYVIVIEKMILIQASRCLE